MLYVDTRRNKFQFRKIQQRIVCIESLMCPQWCFVFFFWYATLKMVSKAHSEWEREMRNTTHVFLWWNAAIQTWDYPSMTDSLLLKQSIDIVCLSFFFHSSFRGSKGWKIYGFHFILKEKGLWANNKKKIAAGRREKRNHFGGSFLCILIGVASGICISSTISFVNYL